MKYIGIMVNNKHMIVSDLSYIYHKVEKRVPTWQSVGLSSGGKMILIESCLSSIPTYTMGVYHYMRRSITKSIRPELTFSGMGHIRKENIIWQNGKLWQPQRKPGGWFY
jgi:hypothetical protein